MGWKEGSGKQTARQKRPMWETAKQKGLGEEAGMGMVSINSPVGLTFEVGGRAREVLSHWQWQASEGCQAGPQ